MTNEIELKQELKEHRDILTRMDEKLNHVTDGIGHIDNHIIAIGLGIIGAIIGVIISIALRI
jgi:hypothetical protein